MGPASACWAMPDRSRPRSTRLPSGEIPLPHPAEEIQGSPLHRPVPFPGLGARAPARCRGPPGDLLRRRVHVPPAPSGGAPPPHWNIRWKYSPEAWTGALRTRIPATPHFADGPGELLVLGLRRIPWGPGSSLSDLENFAQLSAELQGETEVQADGPWHARMWSIRWAPGGSG